MTFVILSRQRSNDMNKFFVMLIVFMIPVSAYSQVSKDLTFFVSGGVSVPVSSNDFAKSYQVDTAGNSFALNYSTNGMKFEFNKTWTSGFNISCGAAYAMSPQLSVLLDVNYNSFHLDKSKILSILHLTADKYVDDADLITVSLNGNVKYQPFQFGPSFSPYLVAGVGIMSITADNIYVLADIYHNLTYHFSPSTVLNTTFGAGIDLLGGESSSLFVEVKGDIAFTQHDSFYYLPIKIGFRGTF
jgi:hypothetical protein